MRKVVELLLVGSMSVVAAAQTVHTVGVGQTHTQIQSAINAAQDGDVVLVDAGTYASFTSTKAVLIRASTLGSLVTVGSTASPTLWQLGPTQSAGIDGLTFAGQLSLAPPAGAASGGVLVCQDASLQVGVVVVDAAISFSRCAVVGYGTFSVVARGASTVSATGSTFRRIGLFGTGSASIDAVDAEDQAVVLMSRCELTGGIDFFSGHTVFFAGAGLRTRGDARVSLADCLVHGYPTAGFPYQVMPGFAIDNQSTLPVVADRCTITNATTPLTQGVVDTTSYRLGASTPTPRLVGGSAFQVDFDARPGMPVVVHAAFGLHRPQLLLPVLAQPEWGFVADSFPIAFLAPDAVGHASISVPLPASPALQHRAVWFLAWSGIDLPLQLSPPVGGWLD